MVIVLNIYSIMLMLISSVISIQSFHLISKSLYRSSFRFKNQVLFSTFNDDSLSKLYTDTDFTTLNDTIVYSRYRKIINRNVLYPNSKQVSFDIMTQGSPSVIVFVWDTKSKSTTLIKEYQPGTQRFLYGTVAGMYESNKHQSPLECAKFELEEEAKLSCNNWFALLNDGNTSIPFDKYSDNEFYLYLALDCDDVLYPKPPDNEEFIVIEKNVTYSKLMNIIKSGNINVASSFCILMAINKLKELSILLE